MILSVRHVTHYRFDPPVRGLIQSLRLIPATFEGQIVQSWDVTCAGASLGAAFRDGAGDMVRTLTRTGAVDAAEIVVTGQVTTTDMQGVLRGHREACPPLAYLRETALTGSRGPVAEFAATALGGADVEALARAHALAGAVSEAISYVPDVTEHGTRAEDALSGGKGVCQDFAHVLIAAARASQIPARYVAGYLYAEGGDAMGEASHAWTELHVPGLGWVGFDPANNCCPDDRYVRLGSGLDAVDAAPVRGLAEGMGREMLDVSVLVTQAQQQ